MASHVCYNHDERVIVLTRETQYDFSVPIKMFRPFFLLQWKRLFPSFAITYSVIFLGWNPFFSFDDSSK